MAFPSPRPRAFPADASGSIAVTTVLVSTLMFGMAALTVDVSRFYLMKRQQQRVTDLAAAAAAAHLGHATAADAELQLVGRVAHQRRLFARLEHVDRHLRSG